MKKLVLIAIVINSVLISCTQSGNKAVTQTADSLQAISPLLKEAQSFFKPLTSISENPENPSTKEKIALGKLLYYDRKLSKDGHNSCNSCHNLETFGVDNEATSIGDAGKRGGRNSPTTLNAAFHFLQFWDGRAKNVEEQSGMPILNPVEMAIPSKDFLVKKLSASDEYKRAFALAYPESKDAVTYENLQNAIGSFERILITPSRFDKYLAGDTMALVADEKHGLELFIRTGCISCHAGMLIGGNMFQKFGMANDYRPLTGSKGIDDGRKSITKKEEDKDFFKVPSLRNIAKTHPYFHDGSVKDLDKAVKVMAKAQLNKELTDAETQSIVKFLESLTGEVPSEAIMHPKGVAMNSAGY
jgi:cytochrome c peroxidase